MNQPLLYINANSVQRHNVKQILELNANKIKWRHDGQDTLIDIGCGTGDVLMDYVYPLLPKNHELLMGTDISNEMIDHARESYGAAYERTKFQILDIGCENLPKQLRGRFDHVTSFYCLHWVQNQKQALQNIYQLIRSTGGDCLLLILVKHPIFDVYKTLSQLSKWSKYMHDYKEFVPPQQYSEDPGSEIGSLLQEAAFDDCSVQIRENVFVYEGVHNCREFIKSVNPFYQRIPEVDRDEYFNDSIRYMKMELGESADNDNDYKFIIPCQLVVAYAHKKGDSLDSDVQFVSDVIKENSVKKFII